MKLRLEREPRKRKTKTTADQELCGAKTETGSGSVEQPYTERLQGLEGGIDLVVVTFPQIS